MGCQQGTSQQGEAFLLHWEDVQHVAWIKIFASHAENSMMWIEEQGKWENLGISEICELAKAADSHTLAIGKMKEGLPAIL